MKILITIASLIVVSHFLSFVMQKNDHYIEKVQDIDIPYPLNHQFSYDLKLPEFTLSKMYSYTGDPKFFSYRIRNNRKPLNFPPSINSIIKPNTITILLSYVVKNKNKNYLEDSFVKYNDNFIIFVDNDKLTFNNIYIYQKKHNRGVGYSIYFCIFIDDLVKDIESTLEKSINPKIKFCIDNKTFEIKEDFKNLIFCFSKINNFISSYDKINPMINRIEKAIYYIFTLTLMILAVFVIHILIKNRKCVTTIILFTTLSQLQSFVYLFSQITNIIG